MVGSSEAEKTDKHRLVLKDYLSITISALAFLTASLTPFFTFLRQSDNVSIVLSGFDPPAGKMLETLQAPKNYLSFVLINLGNRPVAVLDMQIIYMSHPNDRQIKLGRRCAPWMLDGPPVVLETDFAPTVLKEKEAVTKSIHITRPHNPNDQRVYLEKDGSIPFKILGYPPAKIPGFDPPPGDDYDRWQGVGACLLVTVATPAEAYHTQWITLGFYAPNDDGTLKEQLDDETEEQRKKPKVIIRTEHLIFEDMFREDD
jgi:hypothetical protein